MPAEAAIDGVNEAIVSVTKIVFVFVAGWFPGGELAVEEDHIDYIVVDLRRREFRGLKCKCVAPRLVFRHTWKDLTGCFSHTGGNLGQSNSIMSKRASK